MADQRIPGFNVLPPEQERQFQTFMAFDPSVRAWRNTFTNVVGGPPNIDGDPYYDYRKAWLSGSSEVPRSVAGDVIPHWGSAGKLPGHPTAWKQEFVTQFGVDPDQAQQWTPEMQQFMRQQMRGLPLGGLF